MIEIKNLNKTYDNKNKALKNINIHIEQGEFVFIMGRSGSGKSTLMKILLKEVEPTSGQVIVNDMELGKMPRRYVPKYRKMLGVVFQDFRLLKHMTVYENVAFAQRVLGLPVRKIKENAPAMLRQVGLSSKYKSYPDQLSGGEQQRVAIARALINNPAVLLAAYGKSGRPQFHGDYGAAGADQPKRDHGSSSDPQPRDCGADGKTGDYH